MNVLNAGSIFVEYKQSSLWAFQWSWGRLSLDIYCTMLHGSNSCLCICNGNFFLFVLGGQKCCTDIRPWIFNFVKFTAFSNIVSIFMRWCWLLCFGKYRWSLHVFNSCILVSYLVCSKYLVKQFMLLKLSMQLKPPHLVDTEIFSFGHSSTGIRCSTNCLVGWEKTLLDPILSVNSRMLHKKMCLNRTYDKFLTGTLGLAFFLKQSVIVLSDSCLHTFK